MSFNCQIENISLKGPCLSKPDHTSPSTKTANKINTLTQTMFSYLTELYENIRQWFFSTFSKKTSVENTKKTETACKDTPGEESKRQSTPTLQQSPLLTNSPKKKHANSPIPTVKDMVRDTVYPAKEPALPLKQQDLPFPEELQIFFKELGLPLENIPQMHETPTIGMILQTKEPLVRIKGVKGSGDSILIAVKETGWFPGRDLHWLWLRPNEGKSSSENPDPFRFDRITLQIEGSYSWGSGWMPQWKWTPSGASISIAEELEFSSKHLMDTAISGKVKPFGEFLKGTNPNCPIQLRTEDELEILLEGYSGAFDPLPLPRDLPYQKTQEFTFKIASNGTLFATGVTEREQERRRQAEQHQQEEVKTLFTNWVP